MLLSDAPIRDSYVRSERIIGPRLSNFQIRFGLQPHRSISALNHRMLPSNALPLRQGPETATSLSLAPLSVLKRIDSMCALTCQQPSVCVVRFMLVGFAVSAAALLATVVFVAFIIVPDDVRSAVLRGPSAQWRTVVNATGIDNPSKQPLSE